MMMKRATTKLVLFWKELESCGPEESGEEELDGIVSADMTQKLEKQPDGSL